MKVPYTKIIQIHALLPRWGIPCKRCDLPLTDAEYLSGACPMCTLLGIWLHGAFTFAPTPESIP